MTFRNSILAGLTLIREAIQSQNYIPGVEGWKIAANGEAEFSDLTIRSSDGSGATVEIENGKAIFTAATGWKIIIDPTNPLPVIYFVDSEGDEAGAINATGNDARSGLNVSSGPFTDGPVTDYRWLNFMGQTPLGNNVWQVYRTRHSDSDVVSGAFLFCSPTISQVGLQDTSDPTVQSLLQIATDLAIVDQARLYVAPRPSNLPALRVTVQNPGHTGFLAQFMREGSVKFAIDKDGVTSALGNIESLDTLIGNELQIASTPQTTYTPTVAGGGSATFTSRTGRYYKLGDLVFFIAEFVVNAAGSGGSTVTITAPTSIGRTTRTEFTAHAQGAYVAGLLANGSAVALRATEGGAGNVIDRISVSNNSATNRDNILLGSQLTAGASVTVQGWYFE